MVRCLIFLHKPYFQGEINHKVHRYIVDSFYSGPSGILGSDGEQDTVKAGARGVRIVALSISSLEQTQ